MNKLSSTHLLHIELYGDNSERLSGKFETSKRDEFTYGVGNRGVSCRIPTTTVAEKKGYIEDRRPASDMDPYIVTALIANTTILEEED